MFLSLKPHYSVLCFVSEEVWILLPKVWQNMFCSLDLLGWQWPIWQHSWGFLQLKVFLFCRESCPLSHPPESVHANIRLSWKVRDKNPSDDFSSVVWVMWPFWSWFTGLFHHVFLNIVKAVYFELRPLGNVITMASFSRVERQIYPCSIAPLSVFVFFFLTRSVCRAVIWCSASLYLQDQIKASF